MAGRIIKPQDGYQTAFCASEADIVIGGGAAGAGKTFALLIEAMRHAKNPEYGAVIFRRETPEIKNEGGLWDESQKIYSQFGAEEVPSRLYWEFASGASVKFAHLQYEKTKNNYQGAQIPFIGFDELTHFTKTQFFYLLGRNRSMCGVRPLVRCTCNPDPESWVREFISWWIGKDGFPIPERAGKLRYFTQDAGKYVWGNTRAEVIEKIPHLLEKLPKDVRPEDIVKSLTFVPGTIYDNRALMSEDPGYLGNLLSQEEDERKKLLEGNWNIIQDNLALCNYKRVEDIFSNFIKPGDTALTGDVARFGRDLAVLMAWVGFGVVEMRIFTKSKVSGKSEPGKPSLVVEAEEMREKWSIPKSRSAFDEGGVGGGTIDEGDYLGYVSNAPALPPPERERNPNKKPVKENYESLKTQCHYRHARRINKGEVWIDDENIIVDGVKTQYIEIRGERVLVRDLIKKQWRSVKRGDGAGADGKVKMITKEKQKNSLNGASPDFSDCMVIREFIDLVDEENPSVDFG